MASDKNDNSSSSTSAWDKLDDFLTQQAQMMNELLFVCYEPRKRQSYLIVGHSRTGNHLKATIFCIGLIWEIKVDIRPFNGHVV